MNPNNPTQVPSSRKSQAWLRLLCHTASRVGKLAACLLLLASSAQAGIFSWSPPIAYGSLTADQILNRTNYSGGTVVAAMKVGVATNVTVSSGTITFDAPGVWADLLGGVGNFTGAFSGATGNGAFDACLNTAYYDGGTHIINMHNLVVGQQYSVQLFALDDRGCCSAGRRVSWADLNDATDVSVVYHMPDNAYIVGTFTATNTSASIIEYVPDNGNFNCLVLWTGSFTVAPSFAAPLANGSGFPGESAKLTGSASGYPVPTYTWKSGPAGGPYTSLVEGAKYSGTTNATLTINNLAASDGTVVYVLVAANAAGSVTSSEANVFVQNRALVGEWLDGSAAGTNFLDVSGYSLAANHGAYIIGSGNYVFTNDPPSGHTGQVLFFNTNDTGIIIANSSSTDPGYDNTFDDRINNQFTVMCWAKGLPPAWNPFVSKYGDNGVGWQLRDDGSSPNYSCFTIRDNGVGVATLGNGGDDLGTRSFPTADGNWHLYAGTFNALTGQRNLYVDGVLAASGTNDVPYNLAKGAHLCIGARDDLTGSGFGAYSTFQIYDVRVYNYALTQDQVVAVVGVTNPPAISGQPQSIAPFLGRTAQISATGIGGTAPLTNQWTLNGTNIQSLVDATNFTGANSNVLTIGSVTPADVGSYRLTVQNAYGTAVSSNAILTITYQLVVGEWLTNGTLADVSGYQAAGTHDGYTVGGSTYSFSSDVPPGKTGVSLYLSAGDTGIAINNSATGDAGYTNTFNDTIHGAMTVTCWAKGTPGGWNPWVSKYGENGVGWQLRVNGDGATPCWTIRGTGGNEDMSSGLGGVNGTIWHHYAGTYSRATGIRTLYVDGVRAATQSGQGAYNMPTPEHLVIGGRDSSGSSFGAFFTGKIYDVRVYNYDLTSNQVATLAALPDPVIIGQPQSTTNYIGLKAQLSAVVQGTAPLTNQWQFNGTNLVDGFYGGAYITGSTSPVLTITSLTTNLQGAYRLVLSNPKGTLISSNATLTVLFTVPAPATNLVGAWLTGTADLNDHSGYSPQGTHDGYGINGSGHLATNHVFTTDVPPGATGKSVTFNGNAAIVIRNSSTNDVNYTNTYDGTITSMTVTFWAKGLPGSWNPFVSKHGEDHNPNGGWEFRRSGGSSPCWTMRGAGGNDDMTGSSPFPTDGLWHHYAGTYDGTTLIRNLYVDGVLSASETCTGPYTLVPGAYVTIGAIHFPEDNSFSGFYTGQIYDVRIYNTALSVDQINSIMPPLQPPAPAFTGGTPVVTTGAHGPQFTLTYSGTLLSATNVAGPFLPVAGATSPYTVIVSNAPDMFFKLSNP